MSMKIKSLVCMMMMVAALAATAQATVLIRESFETDLSGGTGLGAWTTNNVDRWPHLWYPDNDGVSDIQGTPDGEDFGLAQSGGFLRRQNATGSSGISSAISADLVTPGTIYFSALIESNNGDDTNHNAALILGTDVLDVPSGGNGTTMMTTGEGIGFGLNGFALHAYSYDGGAVTESTGSVAISNGSTVMILGEITWGATDTLNLYSITDAGAPLPTAFATVTGDLDESLFDTLAIADKRQTGIDEIRFGTELADVLVPSPEPYNLAPTGTINSDLVANELTWDSRANSHATVNGVTVDYFSIPTASVTGDDPNWATAAYTTIDPATSPEPLTFDYDTTYFWRVNSDVTWDSNEITGYWDEIYTVEASFVTTPADVPPSVTAGPGWLTWTEMVDNDGTPAGDVQTVTGTVDPVDTTPDVAEADIVWTLENYPGKLDNRAMQMMDRSNQAANLAALETAGEDPNLLLDWIGTDTRYNGDPLTLTLTGLPAGSYNWVSTHHDPADQTGNFSVTVDGTPAATDVDITVGSETPITRLSLTFSATAGVPVEIVFDHNDVDGQDASEAFFVMNGFELDTATPSGAPLKVDFSATATAPDPNKVADGYQAYLAVNENAETFTAQGFAALGTTVTVQPSWSDSIASGTVNASLVKIVSGLDAEATFSTDTAGTYTIRLTATDTAEQSDSATLVVEVKEDACAAALDSNQQSPATLSIYDADGNCKVNLDDLSVFALEWLADISLVAPVERQ